MNDSNTIGGAIDTDRWRNMAAFDALPKALRATLREASQDYACEPILDVLRWASVDTVRRQLRRRDEHARRLEMGEWRKGRCKDTAE